MISRKKVIKITTGLEIIPTVGRIRLDFPPATYYSGIH
jgi:hypothetical protein